jgi:UDP-N-acetylglucosamine 2-epimerase (non-hydrolysing)
MVFFSIIFGTRPEYLKLKPLIDVFKKEKYLDFQVIYIQQHEHITDLKIDNTITFKTLLIQSLSNNRIEDIGTQILNGLTDLISHSTHFIVQGDTATAFYSALYGFQNKIHVVHVEAGLRTYDLEKPFPEEAYRQMISRISSTHFTPHNDSEKLLKDEKVCGKIYTVGNTILDLVKSYNLNVNKGDEVLITFHRRENWEHLEEFINELNKLVETYSHLKFIWFLHPNKQLQEKVKRFIHNNVYLESSVVHYNSSVKYHPTSFFHQYTLI